MSVVTSAGTLSPGAYRFPSLPSHLKLLPVSPSGRVRPSDAGAVKLSPVFTMIWIVSELPPNFPPPRSRVTAFSPPEPSVPGFRTSRTGRKPRNWKESVVLAPAYLRGESYRPRITRFDSVLGKVSCPQEPISLQFLIYPSSLSSILSHSLLWGVPRSKAPEPVPPLPPDGARSV